MVYLRINENSQQAKAVISMLKTMPFVEVVEEIIPEKNTLKASEETEFLSDFEQSIQEVKAKNTKPLKDLLSA